MAKPAGPGKAPPAVITARRKGRGSMAPKTPPKANPVNPSSDSEAAAVAHIRATMPPDGEGREPRKIGIFALPFSSLTETAHLELWGRLIIKKRERAAAALQWNACCRCSWFFTNK